MLCTSFAGLQVVQVVPDIHSTLKIPRQRHERTKHSDLVNHNSSTPTTGWSADCILQTTTHRIGPKHITEGVQADTLFINQFVRCSLDVNACFASPFSKQPHHKNVGNLDWRNQGCRKFFSRCKRLLLIQLQNSRKGDCASRTCS